MFLFFYTDCRIGQKRKRSVLRAEQAEQRRKDRELQWPDIIQYQLKATSVIYKLTREALLRFCSKEFRWSENVIDDKFDLGSKVDDQLHKQSRLTYSALSPNAMIVVKIADHTNRMLNGKTGTIAYYHPVKKGFIFHTEMKGIDKNTAHHPKFLDRVDIQSHEISMKKHSLWS